jgi:hypothetical protein
MHWFLFYMLIFRHVPSGICLGNDIPVTDWKQSSPKFGSLYVHTVTGH